MPASGKFSKVWYEIFKPSCVGTTKVYLCIEKNAGKMDLLDDCPYARKCCDEMLRKLYGESPKELVE